MGLEGGFCRMTWHLFTPPTPLHGNMQNSFGLPCPLIHASQYLIPPCKVTAPLREKTHVCGAIQVCGAILHELDAQQCNMRPKVKCGAVGLPSNGVWPHALHKFGFNNFWSVNILNLSFLQVWKSIPQVQKAYHMVMWYALTHIKWLSYGIPGFPPYLENLENLEFCHFLFQAWKMPGICSKSRKNLEF